MVAWDWGTVAGRSFLGRRARAPNPLENPDPVRCAAVSAIREKNPSKWLVLGDFKALGKLARF
ncbi:hypothetical protein MishRS11D_42210 (plasmid) [Methylomagnum ishizawai]|nr:hypothetical protein MishRS11D_42210 [Methylomagnum ishizawai]